MTNRKSTRRALLLSLLSLLLCCSMLVGTTFAWFTDSVQTGNNKIIAGNLDIELDYSMDLQTWKTDITTAGDIFVAPTGVTKGLWEPGHTEVAYLRITNAGTLSLKYQLQVNPFTETVGKNADGKDIKLSEILKFAATKPSTTALTAYTRETAQAAAMASTGTKLTEYDTNVVTMVPGEVQYIALVVYMPESVGNEANYLTGTTAPSIEFALNLQATQVEAEIDSFGDDYDKDSEFSTDVSTLAELEEAIARGGIINVLADITSENGVTITKDTVLKLNGNTLTATGNRAYMLTVEGNADLTVTGGKLVAESTNGVVDGTGTSTGASSSVYFNSTGKLTMKDVEIEGSVRGGHRAVEVYGGSAVLTNVDIVTEYGSGVNAGSGASVVLNDCDIHVTGIYSQPFNSVCFSVMGGSKMTINSGNYKMVNNNTYTTGDTHGGWVGIVMNSGGTLTIYDGTFTNVPTSGFAPQHERAVIHSENNAPAVSTVNFVGGTFAPQATKVYEGQGNPYYPVMNGTLTDNGDGTWTASLGENVDIWSGVAYITSDDGKAAEITALESNTTVRGMLENNATIEDVTVGEGVATVGNRTFRRCYGLKSVTLPSTLTTIDTAVFQSCTSLTSINIPATVTTIGSGAFQECTSLTAIAIPSGVSRIEKDTFNASGLVEISLPASVTYIGAQAFRDCDALTTVYINAETFTVEANAFNNVAAPFPATTIYVKNTEMQAYLQGVFQDNSSVSHITVAIAP